MFQRTKVYTTHECPEKEDPADRIELVREGFSWLAFFFGLIWLLYQRLWLPALAFLSIVIGIEVFANTLELSAAGTSMLQCAVQFMLGFAANDLKRWRLERLGYEFTGIVTGETREGAGRRYYDAIA